MLEDSYYTILKPSEGFFRDKASKFYAYAFPVETEEEIKEILQNLKKEYYNATHHVYAYKLGVGEDDMRANDDGEPANSSGKPVLGQILSHQLSDVLVVVVRYYGGTKLGVPGLINAYKTAADEALKIAKKVQKFVTKPMLINFDYKLMNQVMRIIDEENIEVVDRVFTDDCKINMQVRLSKFNIVLEKFEQVYGVNILEA